MEYLSEALGQEGVCVPALKDQVSLSGQLSSRRGLPCGPTPGILSLSRGRGCPWQGLSRTSSCLEALSSSYDLEAKTTQTSVRACEQRAPVFPQNSNTSGLCTWVEIQSISQRFQREHSEFLKL